MNNTNFSLIHPEHQAPIYGGIALLTRNEAVKTVAMTTLSIQITFSSIVVIEAHHLEFNEQISPEQMKSKSVRLQNRIVRSLIDSVDVKVICLMAALGSLFALAARAPLPRLKQKVTMSQLSPFWLSGLALTILTVEVNARRVPIERDDSNHITNECHEKIMDNRLVCLLGGSFISMLAILVGTIAFRAGLIFKKPS